MVHYILNKYQNLKSLKKDQEDDFDIAAQVDEALQLRLGNEFSVWKWQTQIFDWVNPETGELLIGEELPEKIKNIIEK
jgi:hypothetical protein